MNGAKTTILGLFGAIGDVFNGFLGGLKLIGNGLVAALAGIESLFNGKSFAENYDKLNIFGDPGVNASSLAKGAIIVGTTAVLIGAGVLLAPYVGAVLATAIIGGSAILLSNSVGIAVEMHQGATFGEAFRSTACGKVDASFAYCSGNIGGQIVTGEALSFGIAKGAGFIDDVAKVRNIVIEETQLQSKYSRHSRDFNLPENYNKENALRFEKMIQDHVSKPNIQVVYGTYRKTQKVVYYIDDTGLMVMKDQKTHNFISGWKLSPEQLENLQRSKNIQ